MTSLPAQHAARDAHRRRVAATRHTVTRARWTRHDWTVLFVLLAAVVVPVLFVLTPTVLIPAAGF